jgi:hypothetical protein
MTEQHHYAAQEFTMPALVVYGRGHTARRSAVIRKGFMLRRAVVSRLPADTRQSDLTPGTLYVSDDVPHHSCRKLPYAEAYRIAKANISRNPTE